MLRNIGAIVAGLVVGGLANMALIGVNLALYPPPEGADLGNPEQLQAYVSTLPAAAFFVSAAAHVAQAFLGGWVAARLSSSRPVLLAMVIGLLTVAATIYNFVELAAPTWTLVELPVQVLAAFLAGELERRRRQR